MARTEPQPEQPPQSRRLSTSEVARALLERHAGGGSKAATVTLGRSASGRVYWELVGTTDPEQLAELEATVDVIVAQHARLATLHPLDASEGTRP